jgi:Fe-S oxidoreductase
VSAAEPRDTLTPWGKMSMAWLASRRSVELDAELALTAWACTGCFACREHCDHHNEVAQTLGAARADFRAAGLAPAAAMRVIEGFADKSRALTAAIAELRGERGVREGAPTALLLGCEYARARKPEARAAIAVARRLFGEVSLVDGCCGYPLLAAGDRAGFGAALERIGIATQGRERLVVLDPGCALMLAGHGAKTLVELAAARLEVFQELPRFGRDHPVRWHDPCKLGRGLGHYDAPRLLLGRILGRAPDELARTRDACTCTGAGGLLPLTMPEVSMRIAEHKLTEHVSAGGGTLVTACASAVRRMKSVGCEVKDLVLLLEQSSRRADG